MLLLQNILYCLLFILMVKCLVRNDGMNCVYFYPKEYIEEADKRGLIDKDAVMKKGKQVMIPFCIILFVVLNWFDGIMLDRVWVGHSKIWEIKGMEGIPYIKPWKTVLTKRGLATILYLIIALVTAGIVVLVGKIC